MADIDPEVRKLATQQGVTEEVEIYFSPKGRCREEIIEELNKAKKRIDLTMYTFTSRELAETLVKAKARGVKIRAYLDDTMKGGRYTQTNTLLNAGIPVKFDNHSGLMHNKFAVIDDISVITGSYNWTKRAEERNDENIVILRASEIVKLYSDKFEEYWNRKK
jgi:phosphatidylserine/phosphatidylglycerophosphate/cardiolipin synthase-like enzyme